MRVDAASSLVEVSVDGEAFLLLPTLHGADVALQVSGDFFPGLQVIPGRRLGWAGAYWGFLLVHGD